MVEKKCLICSSIIVAHLKLWTPASSCERTSCVVAMRSRAPTNSFVDNKVCMVGCVWCTVAINFNCNTDCNHYIQRGSYMGSHFICLCTGLWPSQSNRRETMTGENISWSISMKERCRLGGHWTHNLLITSRTHILLSNQGQQSSLWWVS